MNTKTSIPLHASLYSLLYTNKQVQKRCFSKPRNGLRIEGRAAWEGAREICQNNTSQGRPTEGFKTTWLIALVLKTRRNMRRRGELIPEERENWPWKHNINAWNVAVKKVSVVMGHDEMGKMFAACDIYNLSSCKSWLLWNKSTLLYFCLQKMDLVGMVWQPLSNIWYVFWTELLNDAMNQLLTIKQIIVLF